MNNIGINNMNNNNFINPMMNDNQIQQQKISQAQMMLKGLMETQNIGITVCFRAIDQNPIMIQCSLDDKISDVIDKYRNLTGDLDFTRKFIYNAKCLNTSLTVGEEEY